MRYLLTGVSGFIGHHAVEHLLANTEGEDVEVVGLASFRHRGCPTRLQHMAYHPRLRVVYHELQGPVTLALAEEIGPVDVIWNIASESHVDRSISDPVPFIRNNIDLTLNLLEYARRARPRLFVQISTDEVYGPAVPGYEHKEWDPTKPSNPYSASKAAQEAIAFSYWRTYGVPVVITNTMNNFGQRQNKEKFSTLVIDRVLRGEKVLIHGQDGVPGSRFYLHARNHADALLFLTRTLLDAPPMYPAATEPARYNVVGDREIDNLTLASRIAEIVGLPLVSEVVDFHSSRPGHDLRYALDGSRLAALGWKAPTPLDESLERTVLWTLQHKEWLA